MKRGDIWWAEFGEQGTRPCVIVSPDTMIGELKTVIVAPLASGSRPVSFRPAVTFDGADGVLLLDQVRAIDTTQLTRHAGTVNEKVLNRALGTLQAMFAK